MIKFDNSKYTHCLNGLDVPVLNIDKIVFSTNDKVWSNRIMNSILIFTFNTTDGKVVEKTLSFASLVTPYHRQPIFDVPYQIGAFDDVDFFESKIGEKWKLTITLKNLDLEENESVNIYTIEKSNTDEVLNKIISYLFSKLNYYNSFEIVSIKVNGAFIMQRFTFSDEYLNDEIKFSSKLVDENYDVEVETHRDKITALFPYKASDNQYEIQVSNFISLLHSFGNTFNLLKEEEFGTKYDGFLYYLNRKLNRNASLLAYYSDTSKNISIPKELLSKIDNAFYIDLRSIDVSSPLMCFIFKKSYISFSSSQIFNLNNTECLRIFIDTDRSILDIGQLAKITRFEVELINKDKKIFYNKVHLLSEFIQEPKFILPYIEICPPNSSNQIFTSRVRLFINDKLHDQIEESYIRNINLNLSLKSKK